MILDLAICALFTLVGFLVGGPIGAAAGLAIFVVLMAAAEGWG